MRAYKLTPGSKPDSIIAAYEHYGGDFENGQPAHDKAYALQQTRIGEVFRMKRDQMEKMAQANDERSKALTLTLRCASATPLLALLAWMLTLFCQ